MIFFISVHAALFPWLSVVLNKVLKNSTLANDWDYITQSGRAIVQKRRQEGESGNVGHMACISMHSMDAVTLAKVYMLTWP